LDWWPGAESNHRHADFNPVSAVLGASRSITCNACRPRPQPHPGTITAHPSWVRHIHGTPAAILLFTEPPL